MSLSVEGADLCWLRTLCWPPKMFAARAMSRAAHTEALLKVMVGEETSLGPSTFPSGGCHLFRCRERLSHGAASLLLTVRTFCAHSAEENPRALCTMKPDFCADDVVACVSACRYSMSVQTSSGVWQPKF